MKNIASHVIVAIYFFKANLLQFTITCDLWNSNLNNDLRFLLPSIIQADLSGNMSGFHTQNK